MGKAEALTMLTGEPSNATSGSLVTGEIPAVTADQLAETIPSNTTEITPKIERDEMQSSRLAVFAKKEAQIQREREALKAEREAYLQEKAQADEYLRRGREFDEIAKQDKIKALRLIGWSDEDIINVIADVQTKQTDPIEEARRVAAEEAKKLRDEIAQEKAQAEQTRNAQLISRLKSDISETIKQKADQYEFCAYEGVEAQEQVYEIILENLKLNNELLSVDEALEMAEEFYENKARGMQALKKLQAKQAAEQEAVTQPIATQTTRTTATQPQSKPKTLTNAATATTSGIINRRETPSEKKERLIKALMNGGL
jgi:hypothetical protein